MAIQFKTQISAPHIAGLIGIVYLELTRYEDARNYLLEAYDFSKKKNNALIQGRFAEKIALVEYELLNADSSEKYFDQAIEIAQRTYYNVKRKKIEPFQVQEIYQTFIDLNYKDGTDKPPDEVHRHFANWIKFQNIEVEELNDFQKQAALIRLQQQQNGVTNIA